MNKIFNTISLRSKWIFNFLLFIGILTPVSLFAQTRVGNDYQLRDAIAKGGSVLLTNDINLSEGLDISKDVVLDLGTHALKYEKRKSINIDFIKCSKGNIVIRNGNISSKSTYFTSGYNTAMQINGGKTTIIDCTITGYTEGLTRAGTAIDYNDGEIQIIRGSFSGSSATGTGYAIWSKSKTIDNFTKGCLVKKEGTVLTDLGKTIEGTATVSPINFKITYDTNNGTITSSSYTTAYSILDDGVARTLPTIERSNYKFLYWYNNTSNSVDENTAITTSSFPYKNMDGNDAQTVTLKAKWQAIPYTITYNTDGGNSITDITYTVESTPELPTPVKDGYLFAGWFNGNTPITSLANQSGDMTLTAHWSEYNYTLSFVTNSETSPAQQNYTKKTVGSGSIPATWERKGHTFAGWYDNEKCEGTQVTDRPCPQDGKTVFVSMVLYAKWKPISYKISYTLNEGKNPDKAPASYTIAQTPLRLPVPSRKSSTFMGWYEAADFSGDPVKTIVQNTIGDKHYSAKWLVTYHATCHWNSPTNPDTADTDVPFTDEEEKALPVWTEIDGYEIVGWCRDKSLNGEVLKVIPRGITTDIDLYAKWKLAVFSITYEAYHGTVAAGSPETFTIETEEITLPHAMRHGFTFAGWYTTAALTEKAGILGKGAVGNKTFYAKWVTGNLVSYGRPAHGSLTVKDGTTDVKSGAMVGAATRLTITATPESSVYKLSKLIINGKAYTSSPQTFDMPSTGGLTISAEFSDPRPVAALPTITTDPANTDYIPAGESVTVALSKKDNSTTLYYSLDNSSPRLYTKPFLVSSLVANKVVKVAAISRKEGCKDGVTTHDIRFGAGKITISFALPKGITATNPLGGEVLTAVATGGSFQFKLTIEEDYFETLDSVRVEANGAVIRPDVSGVYTLSNQKANVTVKVVGITGTTYRIALTQTANGRVYFTNNDTTSTLIANRGDRISISATADEDYKFLSWSDGSLSNPREIVAESDLTLQARFTSDEEIYSVVFPETEGVTLKTLKNYSQEVKHGGTCKFFLRLDADYDQSSPVVKANGEVLTAYKEVYSLYKVMNNFSISVGGIQKNRTMVKAAEQVTITDVETATDATKSALLPEALVMVYATAPAGKMFVKWNDGKVDNPRTSTAQDASQLLPLFDTAIVGEAGTKVLFATPVGAGVSTINANADAVKKGDDLQFKVVILPQYSKSKVAVAANGVALQPSLELRASSETTSLIYLLKGVTEETKVSVSGLVLNSYTFALAQNAAGTVSASQSGLLKHGTATELTATPAAGNLFIKWSDGNTLNPYPYRVVEDKTLSALFTRSNSPVANESISSPSAVRLYTTSTTLFVRSEEAIRVQVWNFGGQLVYNEQVPAGQTAIPLPQGHYLVKAAEGQTAKIAVK